MKIRIAAFVLAASLGVAMSATSRAGPPDSYRSFVGRLTTSRGRCTAFPIYSREVHSDFGHHESSSYRILFLTAGHCVAEVMHYEHPDVVVYYGDFSIRYRRSVVPVRTVSLSSPVVGYDIAVLASVMLYPLPALGLDLGYEPSEGEPIIQVGFGRGAWMARVGPFAGWGADGRIVVNSTSSPGNSGGPVIVPHTGKVIGVAVQTTYPPGMERSPIYCSMTACPPQPPYYATSVRKLPGLVKWPPDR